jgi:uncharacterized protein YyaL (SSP411 family)
MPNRLANESSPYLLQHAANPVDWYPWGPEALERARAEEKPIFLSIGYSACHWCHVMEHESFENHQIARLMNEHFVCIKVDREERPDLDQIYMTAVQIMTGRGGWPMSVFLTPELKPFYGGTYWPPAARMGMPGFDQVLVAVADAWRNRRAQAIEQAASLTDHLQQVTAIARGDGEPGLGILDRAAASLRQSFDAVHGGFGSAPKFPHPMDLRVLLRVWQRTRDAELLDMVRLTLDKMAAGGMYDQLGGGFHRYSVDERWLVPHFEKMLYDNALLVPCYVEAFLATGNTDYARVARETCDYVLREMTGAEGGFFSTQDADSEGEEGKFFVWTPAEIEAVLGRAAAATFSAVYDVTPGGNFEHGRSILNRPRTMDECTRKLGRDRGELEKELAASRAKLLAQREKRVHPGLDDKVLVAWNGLMIEALALAAGALDEPRYLAAAQRAAGFVLANMRSPDGRLLHTWRQGRARLDAYLDDYASLASALVSLYESDFDERWIDDAIGLVDAMVSRFEDREGGGFFFTASDHEQLIARQKDLFDNAVPSGNSLAAGALVRLAKLTGRSEYADAAERTFRAASALMARSPQACGQMLLVLDTHLGPTPELVVVGDPNQRDTARVLAALRHTFLPRKVVACRPRQGIAKGSAALGPLFAGKESVAREPALFVCQGFACQAPQVGADDAFEEIERLARAHATGG